MLESLPAEIQKKVKEHQAREVCKAKHRYLTVEAAETRGAYFDAGPKGHGKESRVYRCQICGFFHLTTTPRRGSGRNKQNGGAAR
jgi:rubrerythrin